ncbi:MAG: efflux RND transporter periplasmic adaptor subunit [Bdellovibrionota bacterium]|nr:efflux RND transporter periplasmic adaptor subunit [Pseudomonadota bacterium]MDY6090447.1 efflux RND transporter periplasmic adaptor subunit [Bdellovibrionota bacterium]
MKIKYIFCGVLACVLLGGLLFGVKYKQIRDYTIKMQSQVQPPVKVTSYTVKKSTWKNTIKAVGGLEATQGAMLSAEADGRVVQIAFDSGKIVKKDDLLVKLDTSVEEAELVGAKARLELSRLNLERQKALREKNANSKMDLDNAESEFENSKAAVEQLEAIIKKKNITAPFDGIVGIRLVNVGQMITTGTNIVAVHTLDPLYVNFNLPEQDLAKIKIGNKINVNIDAFPDKTFEATLTAIDSYVDPKTRNILVQGTLSNPQNILRSGIYARVQVDLGNDREVKAIPISSINYSPYGNSVYVISKAKDSKDPQRTAVSKFIRLGEKLGDMTEVLEGLEDGDEIISSATFKIMNNGSVIVDNTIQPSDEINPNPENS